MIELKGGYRTSDPKLDRVPQLDERSREFPIRTLLPPTEEMRSRLWTVRWALDQGEEGACTNFALAHNRVGTPRPRQLWLDLGTMQQRLAHTPEDAEALAFKLYDRSRELDEWPGEDYDGTSALGACKAWKEATLLDEYRWGFGIDDAIRTLASYGPVCFATDWLDSMFEPDNLGMLDVSGGVAGGHMYAMVGVSLRPNLSSTWRATGERDPLLLGWQSWGADWGPKGALFAMRAADADKLLKGVETPGECVVPIDR